MGVRDVCVLRAPNFRLFNSSACAICTSLAGSWEIGVECSPEHMLPLALLTTGPEPTPQTQGPSFKINLLSSAQEHLDLTKTSKDKIQYLLRAICQMW